MLCFRQWFSKNWVGYQPLFFSALSFQRLLNQVIYPTYFHETSWFPWSRWCSSLMNIHWKLIYLKACFDLSSIATFFYNIIISLSTVQKLCDCINNNLGINLSIFWSLWVKRLQLVFVIPIITYVIRSITSDSLLFL